MVAFFDRICRVDHDNIMALFDCIFIVEPFL